MSENETLLSTMGGAVFGTGPLPYYVLQFATFAILILAANTAFADFPRLSGIVATRRFPAAPAREPGDRLVFSNGILVLAGAAACSRRLRRQRERADPAVRRWRVLRFTLSQPGMVVHHWRLQKRGLEATAGHQHPWCDRHVRRH